MVSIEVSLNGVEFSTDEVLFEYQRAARLDELSPSRGPSSGGSALVLTGDGFSRRSAMLGYTFARFNTTIVPVAWVSATELRCASPAHHAGLVSVSLTQNEQQYGVSTLRFEYADAAAIRIELGKGEGRRREEEGAARKE